jgi:hypothetical protein
VWKSDLPDAPSGAVAIDGDLVFAVAGRKIVAVTLPTGDIRWTIDAETEVGDLLAAHERIYFSGADGKLHCLRQRDGRHLWAAQTPARIVGRPVTDEFSVYYVGLDNQIVARERYGGNMRWKAALTARPTPGLALAGPRIVVPLTSGELLIHVTKTGQDAGVLRVGEQSTTNDSTLESLTVTDADAIVRLTTSTGGIQTLVAYRPATINIDAAASLPGTALDLFAPRPPRGRP